MVSNLADAFRTLRVMMIAGALLVSTAMTETLQKDSVDGWTLNFRQNANVPPGFRQFSTIRSDGSIQTGFLVDGNNCLTKRKPLLIFIDGSGAQSHFYNTPDGRLWTGVYGAIGPLAAQEYHVAACDKRGINVGYRGQQSGEAAEAPREYTRYATFDGRVAEIRLLIDRLLSEPMVDASRVVLVGHSEGAVVAAGVAAEDARVTHCAFLAGGGPTQIFDFHISLRKKMTREGRTPEQIVDALQTIEEQFRAIFADPDSETKMFEGHAYRRWASFCSHPPVESLLKTKAKLFLANGTEDRQSPVESFDVLAAEMIGHGKLNVVIRRYPGRDHGLSQPGAKLPLDGVFDEILKWARE